MLKSALVTTLLITTSTSAFAQQSEQFTRDNGAPVGDNRNSRTAGENGGVLLEDVHLFEKLARFDRERIPERVVHARGTGAKGIFVSTGKLSEYSRADLFKAGKQTPLFTRFSTVVHSKGSPEALRDPRGFATKFYTQEGNWDLVGNNLPVFFIRDAKQFPDMVHSLKPSPITNKQDPNRFFEFFSETPESTHMLTQVYTDLGTPASLRKMDGNSVHAFRLVNDAGKVVFAKFRWKSQQGVETLNAKQAGEADFSFATNDLYTNITKGNHPKWDLYALILEPKDIAALDYNPFDATKDWYGRKEVKIGTMTLNEVPENFFSFTEMSAFAPSNLVPGIEPSADRLLQGRLFSYADTQRYRLGANHMRLAVNAPRVKVVNNNQDGAHNPGGRTSNVNYFPARSAPKTTSSRNQQSAYVVKGLAQAKPISRTSNFNQAGRFYKQLAPSGRDNLISNLAGDLGQVRDTRVKTIMLSYFYQADADYGTRLAKAVNVPVSAVKIAVKEYRENR